MDTKPGFLISGTFDSLRYRNFVYLWLGQITHTSALWIDMVARPLLVLAITGSAVHLGFVIALRSLSSVLLGLLAGVIADSFDRRKVVLVTKIVVLILSTLFASILILGWMELWHVYLFTFLRGASQAFDQPARRAMIPSIVPSHLVTNALALSSGSMQATRIFGAGGAGLLIAIGGLEIAFVSVALIYIAAVYFTYLMKVNVHDGKSYKGIAGLGSDFIEGVKFAWVNRTIRGVIVAAASYFTFGIAFLYVFGPLIAKQVLEIGDSGFGYMMASMGVGGVLGSLVLARINPSRNRGYLVVGALISIGIMLVVVSVSTFYDSVLITFITVCMLGLSQSWLHPIVNATLLQESPEDMRGRMLGLLSFDRALAMVGGSVAGFLSATIGPQHAQIVFGIACVIAAFSTLAYPPMRRIN